MQIRVDLTALQTMKVQKSEAAARITKLCTVAVGFKYYTLTQTNTWMNCINVLQMWQKLATRGRFCFQSYVLSFLHFVQIKEKR